MATFELNSIIKIGKFKPFRGVSEVTIKKSIRNYCDTAVVKLPSTAIMKQSGTAATQSVLTAQQFKRGDKINIQLGYNGVMREEFEGFIKRVNKATPCELECEGYAFQLRDKTFNASYKSVTLKNLLSDIIEGTDIVLDSQIPDVPFQKYSFVQVNAFKALELIIKDCGKAIAIWFDKNVLYAGLSYLHFSEKNREGKPDAVYKVGYNIVRDGQMKERIAGDDKVEVEFYHRKNNGKRETARVGVKNSNATRKKLQAIADLPTLEALARAKEKEKNYTGFEGKATGFLQPFYKPGAKVKYIDPKYPEKSGNYLIESTEVKYSTSGARRIGEIGIKL